MACDIQIVAGKRHDVLAECLKRVLKQSENIRQIFIANNTGKPINIKHPLITIVDNEEPLTFEQNHNKLFKLGRSEMVCFIDDDAFIPDETLDILFKKIRSDEKILLVSGTNNQTVQLKVNGQDVTSIGSLTDFKQKEDTFTALSNQQKMSYKDQWIPRIFCPGNLIMTRRKDFEAYGGWDEGYQNWNEEIDYILWGYEHGRVCLMTPSIWFYHCQSTSRKGNQLLENVIISAKHFYDKWSVRKISALNKSMKDHGYKLENDLFSFIAANNENMDKQKLLGSHYYKMMRSTLEP